jgi:DNA-binding response OmpR family regulator
MINKLKPGLMIFGLNNNQNNGLDTLSCIRSISSLPLITISLNHVSVLDTKSIPSGDCSHLTKPVKQMELAARARRYTKKSNLHFA